MPIFVRNLVLIVLLFSFRPLPAVESEQQALADAARLIRKEAGDHRLILIGELHGTRQVPELVAQIVRAYSEQGPVLLGLEIPNAEQEAFEHFLLSDGGTQAKSALLSGAFWQVRDMQHDGRRNYAVVELVETMRRLKSTGRAVDIVLYDGPSSQTISSMERDKAMADRIRRAFAAMPAGRFVTVSGNVHAMTERPSYAPAEMQTSMGSYLKDLDPFSVDISAAVGESWACMKSCGPIAVHSRAPISQRMNEGPYNLLVVLPKLTVAHLLGEAAP